MVNEAVIIELLGNKGDPIQYNCVDGDSFPKGTILKLSDNREVDLSSADAEICAGICAAEKVANDGATTVSVYTNGIFDLLSTGVIGVGVPVTIGGANTIKAAAAGEGETGDICGYALAAFGGAETQSVRIFR